MPSVTQLVLVPEPSLSKYLCTSKTNLVKDLSGLVTLLSAVADLEANSPALVYPFPIYLMRCVDWINFVCQKVFRRTSNARAGRRRDKCLTGKKNIVLSSFSFSDSRNSSLQRTRPKANVNCSINAHRISMRLNQYFPKRPCSIHSHLHEAHSSIP